MFLLQWSDHTKVVTGSGFHEYLWIRNTTNIKCIVLLQDTRENMEVETDGGLAEAADPFETIFAKRGEKQHKSGKKKVVSTPTHADCHAVSVTDPVRSGSRICLHSFQRYIFRYA